MSAGPGFRLLNQFEQTFQGKMYRHRASNLGDLIAVHLYEDLLDLGMSSKLVEGIHTQKLVVNVANIRRGVKARRGDGTFGVKIPGSEAVSESGFKVGRGPLATIEIGVETKILTKAMIKQIDRVCSDLRGQVDHFRRGGGNPISVGIVGVNHAPQYTSFEGDREFPTPGRKYKHPSQEAQDAIGRLQQHAEPAYDFFLLLHFDATNVAPYPFKWVDRAGTSSDYAAMLTRISREFDHRF